MATRMSEPDATVSVGRIIGRAFAVIARRPALMFGISLMFAAVPGVAIEYFGQAVQASLAGQPNGIRDGAILSIGSGLLQIVLAMIVQGALVRATIAIAEERDAHFGESVVAGLRAVFPLILLAIVTGIAVGFGLLLLLVPGVILYVVWSVATPALVEERVGVFGALGRSARLTKDARWRIFGLQLLVLVTYLLASSLLGMAVYLASGGFSNLARTLDAGLPIGWLIVNAVVATLLTTFWGTVQTSLYIELRDWKEGPANRQLEDVFD